MKVYKALIKGFVHACVNLRIVTGWDFDDIFNCIEDIEWYPLEKWKMMQNKMSEFYEDSGPIMERVGIEMMMMWYTHGPGKEIIKRGVDFLRFQTSSDGYYSVVKGPPEVIGEFTLIDIDEENATAIVRSTTPFNKDMERGVLIGGMKAPGDLDYIDVDNKEDSSLFKIKFF